MKNLKLVTLIGIVLSSLLVMIAIVLKNFPALTLGMMLFFTCVLVSFLVKED